MSQCIVDQPNDLLEAVGQTLGPTDPLVVTQERINQFAEATGDDQWIHVDQERAASGPFGRTIAHGYLTLSLAAYFLPQLLSVKNMSMGCELRHREGAVPLGSYRGLDLAGYRRNYQRRGKRRWRQSSGEDDAGRRRSRAARLRGRHDQSLLSLSPAPASEPENADGILSQELWPHLVFKGHIG